jgi:hypothetical protein
MRRPYGAEIYWDQPKERITQSVRVTKIYFPNGPGLPHGIGCLPARRNRYRDSIRMLVP